MRVILVPARLRIAAALLFLCVPLAAFETIIVTRAPWWRLPYRSITVWSIAVFFICLPMAVWLMRGKRIALNLAQFFLGMWLLLNTIVAVRLRNPTLGFFTLLLLALFGAILFWLTHELRRSFLDPRLRWYQGLPKPLPGLTCRVLAGEQELDCRVSRLDREGAFVFRSGARVNDRGSMSTLRTDVKSDLTFIFRERTVRCEAFPMIVLDGDQGAGFQFHGLAPDLRKQLGDFIETLKGEGHVL
jgi:hypothetical protein